jgi:wobble nucleotide-excising tRNase
VLNRLQLLRNIGQFDSVPTGAQIPLLRNVLIYAENGRGKTTLTAILRSLKSGDPVLSWSGADLVRRIRLMS